MMKKFFKKSTAFILVITAAAGLCACSGGSQVGDGEVNGTAESTEYSDDINESSAEVAVSSEEESVIEEAVSVPLAEESYSEERNQSSPYPESSLVAETDANGWVSTDDYTKDDQLKVWTFTNMDVMPAYLDNCRIYTYDDVREAVANNSSIGEEYSSYFYDFIDKMEAAYPDMNLFCFYKNMETLAFVPKNEEEMKELFGDNCCGRYQSSKNKLYFNYEFEQGVEYLLCHEIAHMVTNYQADWKDYQIHFSYDRYGIQISGTEGFNSIFLENILGYTIKGMSYQIYTNYLRTVLEYADVSLEDILRHDWHYFENVLADLCPDTEEGCFNASLVNQMMDAGFYSDEEPYDLDMDYADYYTGKIYFSHNIQPEMTEDELVSVYETLVERLTDGIYSASNIDDIHDFSDLQKAFFEVIDSTDISDSEIPDASQLTLTYEFPKKSSIRQEAS